MHATDWEFRNRALVFGLILAFSFQFYFLDHNNAAEALAKPLAITLGTNSDLIVRLLLALGALLVAVAALLRTWASAYLRAEVVYAADVKSASLVADGPYRHVRNPLYLANVLMAVGMGALASRIGFFVLAVLMGLFCYRLILREEAQLAAAQGGHYEQYCRAVPRLWPSLWARVPSAGGRPNWAGGLKAEFWYWGMALAIVVFAITLKALAFFLILGVSLASFWLFTSWGKKKHPSA